MLEMDPQAILESWGSREKRKTVFGGGHFLGRKSSRDKIWGF